jgi:hypothetical protein
VPETPTHRPPPERPRKLVTQVPAIEARAAGLRGPVDPWPAVREKQPSAPDLAALAAQVAEALSKGQPEEHPDKALGAAVRTLLKQAAPIAAAAIVGAVLTAYTRPTADPAKVDAQAVQIKGNDTSLDALEKRVKSLETHDSGQRAWSQEWAPFELQLWSKLGVKIDLPNNYTPIKTVTPQSWARVKSAPLFEVQTSPPMPPSD